MEFNVILFFKSFVWFQLLLLVAQGLLAIQVLLSNIELYDKVFAFVVRKLFKVLRIFEDF